MSKPYWRLRKFLWPSQKSWTLASKNFYLNFWTEQFTSFFICFFSFWQKSVCKYRFAEVIKVICGPDVALDQSTFCICDFNFYLFTSAFSLWYSYRAGGTGGGGQGWNKPPHVFLLRLFRKLTAIDINQENDFFLLF